MIETEYLFVIQVKDTGKTTVWEVRSKAPRSTLGLVKWYPPWRQYCFFPGPETVFSHGCLEDINAHIKRLMGERRHPK